jgi:hypothetical protein
LTFDLSLARLSLLVEMVSNASMAFASTPQVFTVSAVFSQFGAGFAPAVESVALEVYVEKVRQGNKADGSVPLEIGRLYSGLAVVQALSWVTALWGLSSILTVTDLNARSSQIISPAFFALVYMSTVATAVFLCALAGVTLSFVLLSFVRKSGPINVQGGSQDDMMVDSVEEGR